jgi:ribosomal protein S12 methylthiotransferase accessory factor
LTGFHLVQPPTDLLARSRAAAARVTGRYGIVRRVQAQPSLVPGVEVVAAAGPHRMPGWRFVAPPEGTGVAIEEEPARLAAVAETVERYAAMAPAPDALLVRAACSELDGTAVSVSRFALLSAAQYRRFRRLRPASDTAPIDWVWSASLTHGRPALVPAVLVYLGRDRHPPNDFILEVTSTGTACHVSLPHAVLAALCEVLERDALTVWWQNRLPPTLLDTEGTAVAGLLGGTLSAARHHLRLYALPTDAPFPVVLAVAATQGAPPCSSVGVACRPSPEAAAVRAVFEA